MPGIENYYGLEQSSKALKRRSSRSDRYLAKLEENELLKQANALFVRGNSAQCFGILQKAVTLVPNDFRPYYMLGLIHEENGNNQKSLVAYMAAAILKKNDTSMWRKALSISLNTDAYKNQILALERIFKKEPSEEILMRKLEILKQMGKKYSIVACQIDLFVYQGVDSKIFRKFEKTNHLNSLRKIGNSLYRCIRNNSAARTEPFIRRSIYTLYKVRDWHKILKLLDDYYLRESSQLHPDIRFIYMTAFNYTKEYRVDRLLSFSDLLDDAYAWAEMESVEYVYGLASCFREQGDTDKTIALLEKLITLSRTTRALHALCDVHREAGRTDKAISCLNQVLEMDPVDEAAKLKLHEIYGSLGYADLAEEFETPMRVVEHLKEFTNKQDFRYSAEKCQELRRAYERLTQVKPFEWEEFIEHSSALIEDFFSNPFVIIKKDHFKAFSLKNERVAVENASAIVATDANLSKRQLSDILVRISSLHGLDVDEWFAVVKQTIISMIIAGRCEEALELVRRCFDVYIFRNNDQIGQILFLGVRVCLMGDDLDGIVEIVREMTRIFGHTSAYFLYFISFFFPDFHMNRGFSSYQKVLQKYVRRSIASGDEPVEGNASAEPCGRAGSVDLLDILCFMPRFLQTETVDFIHASILSSRPEINIMKSAILILHTKSRVLQDRMKYAQDAVSTLKMLDETPVTTYNIAKAYHFYGYHSHAEIYYQKVIENGPMELKRMSIFNLSLIYKNNKSRKVLEVLLSKANRIDQR